jgi:hypothetical protein
MERFGETGVQTHFNDFLHYLTEREISNDFVGPDESRRAYQHRRITAGLMGRSVRIHSHTG